MGARFGFFGFALLAATALPRDASAQKTATPIGATDRRATLEAAQPTITAVSLARALELQSGSRPRWIKWGLVGAAAGAVTFGVLSRASTEDPNPLLPDVALGAAVGFVVIGGAVALYDLVCKPESMSERAGLC